MRKYAMIAAIVAAIVSSGAQAQTLNNPIKGTFTALVGGTFQANKTSGPFTFPVAFQTTSQSVYVSTATLNFAQYIGGAGVANGGMGMASEVGIRNTNPYCLSGGMFPCPNMFYANNNATGVSTYVFITAPHSVFVTYDGNGVPTVQFTGRASFQQTGKDTTPGGYNCSVTGATLPGLPGYNATVAGNGGCVVATDYQS